MCKRVYSSILVLFIVCSMVTLLVGCGGTSETPPSSKITPTTSPVRSVVSSAQISHPMARLGSSLTDFRLVLGNEFAVNKDTKTYQFQQDPNFPQAQYEITVDDIKKPITHQQVIKIKFTIRFGDEPLSEHDANRICEAFLPSDAVLKGHYRPQEYGFTADYFYSTKMKNEFPESYFREVDGTLVKPGEVYILYGWDEITTGVSNCYVGLGR